MIPPPPPRTSKRPAVVPGVEVYDALFQFNPLPMLVYDRETLRFLAVNDAAVARYGHPREEFLALGLADIRPIEDHLHPRPDPAVPGALSDVTARHRTRAGEILEVEVSESDVEWEGRPARLMLALDVTRQRAAERALRDGEEKFRGVLDCLGEGIVITDLEDRILYSNARNSEINGFSPEELVGRRSGEMLLPPEERAALRERTCRRARGEGEKYEMQQLRKDGRRIWVEVHATPLRNSTGAVVGTIGAVADVTARRESASRVAQAEAHYRRLVLTSPMAIYALDETGAFTELNPAGERLLGRSAAEVLGTDFRGVVAPRDLELATGAFGRLAAGVVEHVKLELSLRGGTGESPLIQLHASAIREGTAFRGVHGVARDVTEERSRERQMRLLAAVLSGLQTEGVTVTDASGHFVYANATHARLLGYRTEAWHALQEDVFLPDRAAERELRDIHRRVDRAGSWRGVLRRRRLNDGEIVTLDAIIGRVEDDGRVLYFAVLQDAAQRLVGERQLRRAERLASLGTLISGVAHELNNPLHAVINFAELMLMDPRSGDDLEGLQIIQREASRAARVVSDLRLLSRQAQEENAERDAVNLNDVVAHVTRLRRYTLDTHNVELVLDLGDSLPCVFADRAQLEQVILNLVVNAEQAMQGQDRPKRLTLRTRPAGERVALHVQDTGPGIAPAHQDRIFDPFWTTKDPGQGTGLGLSLVHNIVSEHKGDIRVESQQGSGSEFVVELPVVSEGVRPAESLVPAPPLHSLRVLVVDDEPANRRVLVRHLGRRGHRVEEAQEGGEALRILCEREQDVIISDVRMRGLGGEALFAHLQAQGRGMERRVIFVTGDSASADVVQLAADTGVPLLFKPLDLPELTRVVESAALAGLEGN